MAKRGRKYEVFDFTDLEGHIVKMLHSSIQCELFYLPSDSHYRPLVVVGSSSGITHASPSQRFFVLAPADNDTEMQKLYEQAKAEGRVYRHNL